MNFTDISPIGFVCVIGAPAAIALAGALRILRAAEKKFGRPKQWARITIVVIAFVVIAAALFFSLIFLTMGFGR